jgi:hypothetical protein
MDLKNMKLKYTCPHCNETFLLTYHTDRCLKCGTRYNPDEIKSIFHSFESHVENSGFTQTGDSLQGCGQALQGCGGVIGGIGCLIMSLFVLIPLLHFIFSLLK